MIGGTTLMANHGSLGTLASVRKASPSSEKPSKPAACSDKKLKMSAPTSVRRTNTATMNWRYRPHSTVYHFMRLRFLDVSVKRPSATNRPATLTPRLTVLLSWNSGDSTATVTTKATKMIQLPTKAHLGGTEKGCLVASPCHSLTKGVTSLTAGTCQRISRLMTANQIRNGTTQFLSFRCRTSPAIHQLEV